MKNKGVQRFKEENKEVLRGYKRKFAIILSWWSSKRLLGSSYQQVNNFWEKKLYELIQGKIQAKNVSYKIIAKATYLDCKCF